MSFKKIVYILLFCCFILIGCTNGKALNDSSEASVDDPLVLRLGHNMNEDHPVHTALDKFRTEIQDRSNGRIRIIIYPNGQLGSEPLMLEQMQAGVLDIVKVAAPQMSDYSMGYEAFGLPFLFESEEHFKTVMNSDAMKEFFMEEGNGFITLTYFTAGQRSFYTKDTPILKPEDLSGLNIRVQELSAQMEMVTAMGGTPIAMEYGEVYPSLQSGLIDGTENNEISLTNGYHGEVAKAYSYTQHARIPDVLVVNEQLWERLDLQDQEMFLEVAEEITEEFYDLWDKEVEEAINMAKNEMDVEFYEDIDIKPFQEKTEHIIDSYVAMDPGIEQVVDIIRNN
ncbi:C4-dicarboxylate-binding periplasmic protein precursor [Alloiococcus otitis]|uniref:DctP family TRAP transporter solute receptor n=1 Tax=Alloiococcus otitis ATCC 51267 TaxID=883081 RepID=K9EDK2_9LACT|nr:TRAP transporter substrate-binding protein [Alloiococcus otitis]EKU93896.1 DctP family TRAP transporter solute receptor [Alloiococcus otitis ATCC 51267]SUU81702.1 C4-dicarboxylate-binding periplasmic protein precursor [Alloiococcus otitis]